MPLAKMFTFIKNLSLFHDESTGATKDTESYLNTIKTIQRKPTVNPPPIITR